MGYLDEIASMSALRAALAVAARNRGSSGPDGISVASFAASGEIELSRLRDELLSGAYRPRPARCVQISKPGGGHRALAIGCVRDRVVQHAASAILSSALDHTLHDSAYAYRRGRSGHQALAAVDGALAQGREWVMRGDIEEFFDRISPPLLLAALQEVTGQPDLVRLVEVLLSAGALVGGEITDPHMGTQQGSPLSPFLANLYLAPFDRAVETAGFGMVRYGDDICINVLSRVEAERARGVVVQALARLRLRVNEKKAEIRHLGEGFTFLGFQFSQGGRRAGARAARSLASKLEELLAARPTDAHEDVDELLHGWLSYYGSLAGVDLPKAVRARADALEEERVEARIERANDATVHGQEGDGSEAQGGEASKGAPTAEPRPTSTWEQAAILLADAGGAPDEKALHETVRQRLRIEAAGWPELADALVRFDGPGAAELLARAGRFGDATEAVELRPRPSPRGGAAGESSADLRDSEERRRFEPRSGDAERLLELFGGAEHTFLRESRIGDRIERERVHAPPTVEHARAHLAGAWWMGTYPLRANNSVRWACIRIVSAARARKVAAKGVGVIPASVAEDVRRLTAALRDLAAPPILSVEPGRGYVLWVLMAEPVGAARARTLLQMACVAAGASGPEVTRELVPAQDVAKADKPGTPALLPLGVDPRSGQRAWPCDDTLEAVRDPIGWLHAIVPLPSATLAAAVASRRLGAAVAPGATEHIAPIAVAPSGVHMKAAPPAKPDGVSIATSPFRELPRAQDVYAGCNVLRHFVDKAMSGQGLVSSERYLVADGVGRLGDESIVALDAIFRHLDDYKPSMAARYLDRLYPNPTSCGRIRQNLPELTARVGCDCRFRVPPGAYPTPVLHALGAADVPGLGERVRDAASRGGLARAAVAAMNEGRKDLGARAAALCARLSDLRRQIRVVEKSISGIEAELDAIVEEAGDTPLETPAGTLRRVVEGGGRRFILEV